MSKITPKIKIINQNIYKRISFGQYILADINLVYAFFLTILLRTVFLAFLIKRI